MEGPGVPSAFENLGGQPHRRSSAQHKQADYEGQQTDQKERDRENDRHDPHRQKRRLAGAIENVEHNVVPDQPERQHDERNQPACRRRSGQQVMQLEGVGSVIINSQRTVERASRRARRCSTARRGGRRAGRVTVARNTAAAMRAGDGPLHEVSRKRGAAVSARHGNAGDRRGPFLRRGRRFHGPGAGPTQKIVDPVDQPVFLGIGQRRSEFRLSSRSLHFDAVHRVVVLLVRLDEGGP